MNQNHRSKYGWLPEDESELPQYPAGKGARYVVLHEGCRKKGYCLGVTWYLKPSLVRVITTKK